MVLGGRGGGGGGLGTVLKGVENGDMVMPTKQIRHGLKSFLGDVILFGHRKRRRR